MIHSLLARFQSLLALPTYGSVLEQYIVQNNPTNESDIERLTREFHQRPGGGTWQ